MNIAQRPFSSILVANRGEIACRIMRTAKSLGLKTIAVFSSADESAQHVKMADAAAYIGPPPPSDSYLNIDNVLAAAKATGAEAIHPGYGFLSENSDFARACNAAGQVFIGPSPDAIGLMGDKAKAKRRMIAAGVPCVPGYHDEDQADRAFMEAAKKIGFPVMVKAAAGGGGRGMRLVQSEAEIDNALKSARSEAESAFGSGDLILEKALLRPRHVEIQIFADVFGNVIHLGERDCSVQRRHQKIIEESPCPMMTPQLREKMGAAAIKAARDINYAGAGTVEFLLDQDGTFYFLEMNTRLQVEHPVTEMVTGLDLVEWQIRVAQGEPLGFTQKDIHLTGHAMEARLYAEDVGENFLPSAGTIDFWRAPMGARTDAGIETGDKISSFYDPMIAKVIAHGATHADARRSLVNALKQTVLFGVQSNKAFLINALDHPTFVNGKATTSFISDHFPATALAHCAPTETDISAAALLQHLRARQSCAAQSVSLSPALLGWSSASKIRSPLQFKINGETFNITVMATDAESYSVCMGKNTTHLSVESIMENDATLRVNGNRVEISYHVPMKARIQLSVNGRDFEFENLNDLPSTSLVTAGAGAVTAPMHGLLVEICVKPGDKVTAGTRLAILEAMKMQHELTAEINGEVGDISFSAGEQVAAGVLLMELKARND